MTDLSNILDSGTASVYHEGMDTIDTALRITADCVNAPQSALPAGFVLVEAGPVIPGTDSTYASRIVLARIDTDLASKYATWQAVYPDDPEGSPYCINGHYFGSLADKMTPHGVVVEAAQDYSDRVRRGY